jgi:hypothetical protein
LVHSAFLVHEKIGPRLMIAEIIPEAYDAAGRRVSPSFFHHKAPHAALPIGRYVSQPLTVKCESIRDVRRFLAGCRAVSAQDLFGKRDHWQPPEEFERLKKGGCVDFSLWTWRQMLSMGYDARFVGGSCGRYGTGHAWVEYFVDGKCFLLEPQLRMVGDKIPQLTSLKYIPKLSVAWDGKTLKYFIHKRRDFKPGGRILGPLVWNWLLFWGWFWMRAIPRLPLVVFKRWRGRRRERISTAA